MIFAGHESTAGTLAATLGFLAINPKEQELVYQEIVDVAGKGESKNRGEWGVEAYDKLIKTRSAFAEALRMIPAASMMIRETTRDTVVKVPYPTDNESARRDGKGGKDGMAEKDVLVKKGTILVGDLLGARKYLEAIPRHLFLRLRFKNCVP